MEYVNTFLILLLILPKSAFLKTHRKFQRLENDPDLKAHSSMSVFPFYLFIFSSLHWYHTVGLWITLGQWNSVLIFPAPQTHHVPIRRRSHGQFRATSSVQRGEQRFWKSCWNWKSCGKSVGHSEITANI